MTGAERLELVEFRAEMRGRFDKQDVKLEQLDSRIQNVEVAKKVADILAGEQKDVAKELERRQEYVDKHALSQKQIKWGGAGIVVAITVAVANFVIAHGAAIAALAILL